MCDFKEVIQEYCGQFYPGSQVRFGEPATEEDLCELSSVWKLDLPDEFVQLYQIADGVMSDFKSKEWLILPIKRLAEFWYITKLWFPSEDQRIGDLYRPFMKVAPPDNMGYFLNEDHTVRPGLWYFNTSDVTPWSPPVGGIPAYLKIGSESIVEYFSGMVESSRTGKPRRRPVFKKES